LLSKKFIADGYPQLLIFKRWWSFKPVREGVIRTRAGLGSTSHGPLILVAPSPMAYIPWNLALR